MMHWELLKVIAVCWLLWDLNVIDADSVSCFAYQNWAIPHCQPITSKHYQHSKPHSNASGQACFDTCYLWFSQCLVILLDCLCFTCVCCHLNQCKIGYFSWVMQILNLPAKFWFVLCLAIQHWFVHRFKVDLLRYRREVIHVSVVQMLQKNIRMLLLTVRIEPRTCWTVFPAAA